MQSTSERLSENGSLRDWSAARPFPLGSPNAPPHPVFTETFSAYAESNFNNIGLHIDCSSTGTRTKERKLIEELAALFHCPDAEGYITSGGTEGNLMGLWLGRENRGKTVVLTSDLAHYSVRKAARILNMGLELLPRREDGSIDPNALKEFLLATDATNVVVVLTIGHTTTGTIDAAEEIDEVIRVCTARRQSLNVFLHIDAAFAGFILPFTDPGLLFDFRLSCVQTLSVDGHKAGGMGYGCGFFLARKGLLNRLGDSVEYTGQLDRTFSGSRSGALAAAAYETFKAIGHDGYLEMARRGLDSKTQFLGRLSEVTSVQVIGSKSLNVAAIHFRDFPDGRLPLEFERRFGLTCTALDSGGKKENFYKLYFMHYLTDEHIDTFMELLSEVTHHDL